jgi:glycosyltransferase involved in cell wall biosynthesis
MTTNKPLVSICIPTYEMHNKGNAFLKQNLDSIAIQTYQNIEIIISDHSKNKNIEQSLDEYSSLNIKYLRNTVNLGSSSANTNNAILNASGSIIKILFQDDWLFDKNSIEYHVDSLIQSGKGWSISACAHSNDGISIVDEHQPHITNNILFHNTLSSPSTLLLYKAICENFDTNLLWYMDTDLYYRLYKKYGPPNLYSKVCVINRRHPNQVTNTLVNNNLVRAEQQYLLKKYTNQ